MRLLVLGGTSFLGRHTVAQALRRGWQVTTFNRGQAGPDAEGVEVVRGDRASGTDLEQLADRAFDVVVDTCGELKAGCERAVSELFPDSATLVRAAAVLGPYENVNHRPPRQRHHAHLAGSLPRRQWRRGGAALVARRRAARARRRTVDGAAAADRSTRTRRRASWPRPRRRRAPRVAESAVFYAAGP